MKIDKNCEFCSKKFKADIKELNRGNAKYCSLSCAAKNKNKNTSVYKLNCKNCSNEFSSKVKNAKYCSKKCKSVSYYNNSKSEEFSMKTFNKVLANLPCEICGWDKTTRDNHHIIPVSEGGKNTLNNLIVLCPNCHRMTHKNLISKECILDALSKRTISSP